MSVVVSVETTGHAGYSRFRRSLYHCNTEPYSPARECLEGFLMNKLEILPSVLGMTIKRTEAARTDNVHLVPPKRPASGSTLVRL